jgi:hypothetical protein
MVPQKEQIGREQGERALGERYQTGGKSILSLYAMSLPKWELGLDGGMWQCKTAKPDYFEVKLSRFSYQRARNYRILLFFI